MAAKATVGVRGFSRRDTIKLVVASVLLVAAGGFLIWYFTTGEQPQQLIGPGEGAPLASPPTRATPTPN